MNLFIFGFALGMIVMGMPVVWKFYKRFDMTTEEMRKYGRTMIRQGTDWCRMASEIEQEEAEHHPAILH